MPVSDKKREYAAKLRALLQDNRSVLIVGCDNVGSKQMQSIRLSLRGTATLLMGKNTTVRKVLKDFLKDNPGHPTAALMDYIVGNTGFVFTNADLSHVRDVLAANKVPAPARVGSNAPVDVWVEPGPTGCDPGQTAWFQALNIPTKINKGQIEMISRVHLVKLGDRVGNSEAALLQKLNIKPFSYGLVLQQVYDNGDVFEPALLDISPADIFTKLSSAISTLAAVCLEIGYPTLASVPHTINNAFKTLVAVSLESEYKFPAADAFADFLANPGNFVAAAAPAPAAAGGAAAPAAKKVESSSEESVGGAGGGLSVWASVHRVFGSVRRHGSLSAIRGFCQRPDQSGELGKPWFCSDGIFRVGNGQNRPHGSDAVCRSPRSDRFKLARHAGGSGSDDEGVLVGTGHAPSVLPISQT